MIDPDIVVWPDGRRLGLQCLRRAHPEIGNVMRKLDSEEQELLEQLNAGLPTDALIAMLRDLADVLTKEGLAVRARVAETAADRLEQLNAARIN